MFEAFWTMVGVFFALILIWLAIGGEWPFPWPA